MKIGIGLDIYQRRVLSSSNFQPSDISGCILWVRADSGILIDAGGLNTWADKSPAGNDLTQLVLANKPQYVLNSGINGHPGIQFSTVPGTPQFLERAHNPGLTLSQGTILGVARSTIPGGDVFLLHKGSYNLAWNYGLAFGYIQNGVNFFNQNSVRTISPNQTGTTVGRGLITTFSAASWSSYMATAAGVFQGTDSVPMPLFTNTIRLTVGTTLVSNAPAVPYYTDGIICELALYNRIVTYPEFLSLAAYISNRYNFASII